MDANLDDAVAAFQAARRLFCILFRMEDPHLPADGDDPARDQCVPVLCGLTSLLVCVSRSTMEMSSHWRVPCTATRA